MARKSAASKLVRHGADYTPKVTASELARLEAAMDGPIDTSDSPEHTGPFRPIKRDEKGRLPEPLPELRDSPIRRAILDQLDRRTITRYRLWTLARPYCPQITRSAVYEYLRGERAIGVQYVEALIKAAGLVVKPETKKKQPRIPAAAE